MISKNLYYDDRQTLPINMCYITYIANMSTNNEAFETNAHERVKNGKLTGADPGARRSASLPQ
jgi:hypothetical protein